MNEKQHVKLTKDWIMTMLYDTPKSFDDLMINGCKVMVYGHDSYDDVEKITNSLLDEKKIRKLEGKLNLTGRGIFDVKKYTIIPLLKLTENPKYFKAFIGANREKCDVAFLEQLAEESSESYQVRKIKSHSEQNYLGIVNILQSITRFLSAYPQYNDTQMNFPVG